MIENGAMILGLSSWIELASRADGASFDLYGMRRKRMVYNQTRNVMLIVGMVYVYRCIYCASHEGVTLTREE
jgi:hypothetical protein